MNANFIFNIYLDILKSSIYGNTYSKLLKTVNTQIDTNLNMVIYKEINNPVFLPLSSQTMSIISKIIGKAGMKHHYQNGVGR